MRRGLKVTRGKERRREGGKEGDREGWGGTEPRHGQHTERGRKGGREGGREGGGGVLEAVVSGVDLHQLLPLVHGQDLADHARPAVERREDALGGREGGREGGKGGYVCG